MSKSLLDSRKNAYKMRFAIIKYLIDSRKNAYKMHFACIKYLIDSRKNAYKMHFFGGSRLVAVRALHPTSPPPSLPPRSA